MGDDTSDILATNNVPIVRGSPSGRWSGLSFGIKSTFILAVILALYVASRRLWESLLLWREKSYKLSMRRRHGIPDNDHRPFNVAYAAAMRARQENEAAKRRAKLEEVTLGQDHRNALPDQNLRLRSVVQRNTQSAWPNGVANTVPGELNPSLDDMIIPLGNTSALKRTSTYVTADNPFSFDRYNPSPVVRLVDAEFNHSPPRAGPSRRSSRKNLNILDDEVRKRAFDEEEFEEPDHPKKSRVEGEELIDGDEDPEWEEYKQIPQRGSKRVLVDEDENEDVFPSKRARDKRARKVSLENALSYQSDNMEIDDNEAEDEVAELKSISRGKKRDRAEAGSTFGGDDEDSIPEAEIEDDVKARRRRRKRRTVGKRKSDASSSLRGQKRDRDIEDGDSDLESLDGELLKVSRKKGKRSVSASLQDEEDRRDGSDLSMDESQTSSKEKGRRIGDEWESNGVMFKIGPNGQRLRQALIKKARQKFSMPLDSQHPDRDANLEVCVETWLTEEEFREAKAQRLLAWQDSPKAFTEPESPSVHVKDPPSPPPAGKNLLWRSRSAAPSPLSHLPAQATSLGTPPRQSDPYRQSIATNVGLRLNPFQQTAASGKRIASGARVASVFSGHGISSGSASPGLTDSTNGSSRNGYKTFSKWEKQDLEAKAMMKMREANMKKQAEKEQKEKEDKEKAEKEKKEKEAMAAATSKPIPTITITTPDVKAPQTESKTPMLTLAPPSASEATKAAASKQTSFFGPPPGASVPPFTLGNAPSLKSEDKPSAKSTTPQPSRNTFFTNVSSGLPAKPTIPLPGGVITDNKLQLKPQSTFSFPAPPNPETDSTAGNPARPAFPVNSTPSQPPQTSATEGLKDGQGATDSSGGSLLSRLAPSAQPQQSSFSFSKPAPGEAQKPLSVFGNTNTQAASSSATTTANSTTSKPKFDFGLSNKPPNSAPVPAASTSSLSGALGSNAAKPASTGLSFNFKVPAAPTGGTSGANIGATASTFSFGAPSSGPAGGETSPFIGNKASAPAPQSSEVQSKPLLFGTTTPFTPTFGTNPFGGNKDSAATSAVPQSSENQTKPSPFGATIASSTSPFGAFGESKGSTPAAASQSNESQNTPSAFNTASSLSTSPLSFFGDTAASQLNDTASKSAFTGFGNGTQGTPFGTSTGSGAGLTVFGSSGNSNVFGSGGAITKPAETTKATFSWPTAPSSTPAAPNTGEASRSTFAFGGQAVTPALSTPATNGTSSPFTTFKFGDSSKVSTPQASPAGQSLFGGTSTGTAPSGFGIGAPPSTNGTSATSSSGLFSNPSVSTGQQQ